MFQISNIATKTCPLNVNNIFPFHNRVCFDLFLFWKLYCINSGQQSSGFWRSMAWQLLNQNNAKQQVCKEKAQKGVDQALELKSQKQQKKCLELHQLVSRMELVDKVPLCCASLRACMVAPGSGTTTTAVSHYEVGCYRIGNLILWAKMS